MDFLIDPYRFRPIITTTLTSSPYPATLDDALDLSGAFTSAALYAWPIEGISVSHAFVSGSTTVVQLYYGNWPAEGLSVSHAFLSGSTAVVQLYYGNWLAEGISVSHAFISGSTTIVQITYNFWPEEGMDFTSAFVSGALI